MAQERKTKTATARKKTATTKTTSRSTPRKPATSRSKRPANKTSTSRSAPKKKAPAKKAVVAKGKRTVRKPPSTKPPQVKGRPREKKKPPTEAELLGEEEDSVYQDYQQGVEKMLQPKATEPDEVVAFMFLQVYLQTFSIYDAARYLLPVDKRKNAYQVRKLAKKVWNSQVFQEMLDDHLADFGKKSKRLKRMTIARLQQEMTRDDGVGSHAARVRACEAMLKTLEEEKIVKNKASSSSGVLVIPGAMSLEDWAKSAEEAQVALREKTREANNDE